MSLFTKRKEAESAAVFIKRSNLKNTKAIQNLGRFAAELDLFTVDNESDDWDTYNLRCEIERSDSEITIQTQKEGISPVDAISRKRQIHLDSKEQEFSKSLVLNPFTNTQPKNNDTNSVDWQNPQRFLRTALINAAIDNDILKVKSLVEKRGANLYLRDIEGNTALAASIKYGNMEIASYLQSHMTKQPTALRA